MGLFKFAAFISSLRVNVKAAKKFFKVPRSRLVKRTLGVLYREGLIGGYRASGSKSFDVSLKYFNGKPVFNDIRIFSKPGHSTSYSRKEIFRKFNSFSPEVFIFSTNKGVISNKSGICQKSEYLKNLRSSTELVSKIFFSHQVFFVELYESSIYDIDFFSYKGCFSPVSSNSLKINLDFVNFFKENKSFFFYFFSDSNFRSFPVRFVKFLNRFKSSYNFVDFASKTGLGIFIKFILIFLLNFSRCFSKGFVYLSCKKNYSFKVLRRILLNFFFSCNQSLNFLMIYSANVINIFNYSVSSYSFKNIFNGVASNSISKLSNGYIYIRKCFFNCVDIMREKNNLVTVYGKISFYLFFYMFIRMGFFINSVNLRQNYFFSFFSRSLLQFSFFKKKVIRFFFSFYVSLCLFSLKTYSKFISKNEFRALNFKDDIFVFEPVNKQTVRLEDMEEANLPDRKFSFLRVPVYFFLSNVFKNFILSFLEFETFCGWGLENTAFVNLRKGLFSDGGQLLISVV